MQFERFTESARKVPVLAQEKVLVLAQEEGRLLNHGLNGTEHILLGLTHESEGVAAKTRESLDISLEAVPARVAETGSLGAGSDRVAALHATGKEDVRAFAPGGAATRHSYIGTEHILLGQVTVSQPRASSAGVRIRTGCAGRSSSCSLTTGATSLDTPAGASAQVRRQSVGPS